MNTGRMTMVSMLAAVGMGMALPAIAQDEAVHTIVAPEYESGTASAPLSLGGFDTPESDGRPGVKFFAYATQALRQGDYQHAVDMFKVSASWAYKPAEYDLGVMYFNGRGVPVDKPLGAAWMILAAEPGNPSGNPAYAVVRDHMVTALTDAQFSETDKLWARLRKTYGDKVALRRAKAQWAFAKSRMTGSRVGGTAGELSVGVLNQGMTPVSTSPSGKPVKVTTTSFGMMQSGSMPGAISYRQFQQSSDPYAPIFLKTPPNGKATVGPLENIRRAQKPASATSAGGPA